MRKSFTLIELLVVIAIIGILSSLVIARFSDWGDNARIANTLQWSAGVHRKLGANLVRYWPLNGNLSDISGYGNHGSCYLDEDRCPTLVDGIPGAGNMALEFDGINDYVVIPTIGIFDGNKKFSISAFYNQYTGGRQRLLSLFGERGFQIQTGEMQNNNVLHVRLTQPSWTDVVIAPPHIYNTWNFLVVTYDPVTGWILYFNGEKKDDSSNIGNIGLSEGFNSISTSALTWHGKISDVRIYDTALTAEEVSRIYVENRDKYLTYDR